MTLYAKADNYNCYTLYNITRRMDDEDENERNITLLDAEFMIAGAEFPSKNSFKYISFDLVNLSDWFPRFRYASKNFKRKKQVFIPFTPSVTVNTPNNISITFHSEVIDKWKPYGVAFELSTKIILKSNSTLSFNELFQQTQKYRTLFQLMSGRYSAITEIFIHDNDKKYRTYFIDEKSDFNLKWGAGRPIFLNFKVLEKTLPKIIINWEKLYIEIKQVIDILTMEYHNYNLSPEVRFLNIARAIETFHRKLRINKAKDEKLAKLVVTVKKGIPKKYKNKFDNSLNYIQESTLRDRVIELYSELKKQTQTELNLQDDWINKFVKSRNYYTHFGKKNKDVLTGSHLQELSNRVRTLLYILITKELGIKEKVLMDELHHLILL